MNLRELKEIFRLVEKTDFTEVEIVQGDWRLRVERGKPAVAVSPSSYVPSPTSVVISDGRGEATSTSSSASRSGETGEKAKADKAAEPQKGEMVTSPFVGTFYRSPSPDSDSYVEVGTVVKEGQVLCIVEAMKLMNELESEVEGRVAEIYAGNGQSVEFGEKLFRIEPL